MKYIKSFALYEGVHDGSPIYNEIMGKLLHLYGSIPVPKEKSSVVISKIIISSMGELFKLGQNVDINFCKTHDKIRFSDYFDSLLNDKDSRGHNFEGFIAGLFGGKLSTRGAKYDLTIDGLRYSVKFVDHKSKAPEIGKFKSIITSNIELDSQVTDAGGLTKVFKSTNNRLKRRVWNAISSDIDGWILAYPDDIKNPTNIVINVVDKSEMFKVINLGYVVAPKGGYNDLYSLALSSRYVSKGHYIKSVIKIPQVSLKELMNEYKTVQSEDWAIKVFGNMGYKMRPDVLRYIRLNKDNIIKRLNELD
jgi:hypothetical protein